MFAFYADHFVLPLPPGHRFPMRKYSMLRDAVLRDLPDVQLHEAPRADDAALALAHTAEYIAEVSAGQLDPARQREIGFPWSHEMVERSRRSAGATMAACRTALDQGIAVNLAGGTHHAYADKGGGFCVFNDAAIAARHLKRYEGGQRVRRVAVIDLDVHQGNGTASILHDDPTVFTLSLHGEKNYPFRKEASDLDVGLPDGCDDDGYAQALAGALDTLQAETGLALLFVTHDLGIVMQIGDSVSVMYCGRIVEHGLASELLIRPQHPYTRDLMACRPTLIDADRRLASIPGSVPPIGARPAGCSFEPRCRRATDRCRTDRPDLRDGHGGDAVACFNPL